MAAERPLLEVRGLRLARGGQTLCDGLEFQVRAGECWGILGPNGSGKTTLLHTMAGLCPPAQGSILLNGEPLADWPRRRRARILGVMLQNEEQVFPVSVLDRVLAGRHPHMPFLAWESADDVTLAREALARVGLSDFEERLFTTLSGGERRRLQIAALLCQAPLLALLDEPENDLDLRYQADLIDYLTTRFTAADRALVMVLHDINLALRHCSHLILIGNGRSQAGTVEMLGNLNQLSALYACALREVADGKNRLLIAD